MKVGLYGQLKELQLFIGTIKVSSATNWRVLLYSSMTQMLSDHKLHAIFKILDTMKTCWQSFEAVGNNQEQHTCNELNVRHCDEQITTTELAFDANVIGLKKAEKVYFCNLKKPLFKSEIYNSFITALHPQWVFSYITHIFILPSGQKHWGSPWHDFTA